ALIEYAVNTDIIKVFLYDNFSNLITKNNSGNGWKIPVNSGNRALDFNAILGSAPESYWRYAPKLYRKQSRIFINEIPINAGKGQNIKVLIIGDSLTNYNIYPNRTGELANSDENTTIEFIGTRGDNTKHEGRGGWSAKIYTTKTQYNSYDNPFLNNGKFDFSNYMNTNNFSDVDIVIINLGTNDIALNRPDIDNNFSEDFKAYDEMISSIKAYDANIKIALGSTITPARLNNANIDVKTRRQHWNRLMARYCSDNNYTYIPYGLVVDPINDFKYDDVPIDEYNQTIIKKVADNTHPADSGYKKMGDLTYATIKKIAEDIRVDK
ncbi:SGNH/GDSL hydrolase family protein, partial [Ligilactobacillus salivarius]